MPRAPQPIRDAREAAVLGRHLSDPDPHTQYAKNTDITDLAVSITSISASLTAALTAIANLPSQTDTDDGVQLDEENTWTARQRFDIGSASAGVLPPSLSGASISLASTDASSTKLEGFGFSGYGIDISGRMAGGSRGLSTASDSFGGFIALSAYGYRNGAWDLSPGAVMRIDTNGTWSAINKGTQYRWEGTANGSTSRAEWMTLKDGMLGIGSPPSPTNGLLQLEVGTTKAKGIAFGTDTFLYRAGDGVNLEQTWNSGATLFNGLYFNVTDTASNAGSKLLTLSVAGVPKFRVQKDGSIIALSEFLMDGTSLTQGTLRFQSPTGAFVYDGDDTVGLTICAAGAKLGFYDTTPIVQPAAIADVATTAATNIAPYGYTTQAQADSIITKLNAALAALRTLGLIAP